MDTSVGGLTPDWSLCLSPEIDRGVPEFFFGFGNVVVVAFEAFRASSAGRAAIGVIGRALSIETAAEVVVSDAVDSRKLATTVLGSSGEALSVSMWLT